MSRLFSVVIPTYNRAAFLRKTLDSVFAQEFTDFEVIVVDDGSTDNTSAVILDYRERIRVLRQTNAGPGAARNLGASVAQGIYLAFLDSDDLWFPWTLTTFARLIDKQNSPAILSAKVLEFSNESELAGVCEKPLQCRVFPDYLASHRSDHAVGAGMAVLRREEFSRIGGFTTRRINAEDHDLILRLGIAQRFVAVLSPATLAYRRHASGATKEIQHLIEGSLYIVAEEQSGGYPGGAARARERREIITRHVRPVALECLRLGLSAPAYRMYRATFAWHVRLWRWKYLAGFPVIAALATIRRPQAN